MKHLLLKLEPVIWLLFGAGLSVGTMLLTGFVLVVGLAIPMGLVPSEALDYERAHEKKRLRTGVSQPGIANPAQTRGGESRCLTNRCWNRSQKPVQKLQSTTAVHNRCPQPLKTNYGDDGDQAAQGGSGVEENAHGAIAVPAVEVHGEGAHVVGPLPERKSNQAEEHQPTETI
jgi:hypothetical protein